MAKSRCSPGGQTHERQQGDAEQAVGQGGGASAGGPQGVVGGSEGLADAAGAEPGGDGSSAACEQGAEQEAHQPWRRAPVEHADDLGKPGGHNGGKVRE